MATMTIDYTTSNVTIQVISDMTSSTGGSSFTVTSTFPVSGRALASPGQPLTVQIGIENGRGDPNTCTLLVTDSHLNNAFRGEAVITWDQDDTSLVWVQFSEFPLQADQETPMDACTYSISLSTALAPSQGTEVSAQVFTL